MLSRLVFLITAAIQIVNCSGINQENFKESSASAQFRESSSGNRNNVLTLDDLGPFTDLTPQKPSQGAITIDAISGRVTPLINPNWAQISEKEKSEIVKYDGEVSNYGLINVIYAPNYHFTNRQKQLLMERHMKKYYLPILKLSQRNSEDVRIYKGHGPSYFLGHPDNYNLIQEMIEREKDSKKKEKMYRNIRVFQQVMRYLHASKEAAIVHKPSESILLSPRHDQNIGDIFHSYATGKYPKLINGSDRGIHFKTSLVKKHKHRDPQRWRDELPDGGFRGGNGKGYREETSSEEEDDVIYPTINRVEPR